MLYRLWFKKFKINLTDFFGQKTQVTVHGLTHKEKKLQHSMTFHRPSG